MIIQNHSLQCSIVGVYPLVNSHIAIENGPVEIVDLPMNSMVDLSSALRKRLPDGK